MHLQMKMLLKLPCHRTRRQLLRINQRAQGQQCSQMECGTFHDFHAPAGLLIQHPLRNKKLVSTWKSDLHLMKPERGALPHQRHNLAALRMKGVVNLR